MAGAILAVTAPAPALAADEDPFFTDLPVVASVSRLPQRLQDASASVTVIDRDMIKASGARDLNDLFRLVPGFQTFPNNTDGARVTYHGLTDEEFSPRVQVLIDGRSQYSPLFRNGVNWATLPVALEDIERIEVVRGSNAVSYGSNAFLGVINIITVSPALVRGVSVGVNRGSQGVRDVTVRGGRRLGDAGDIRATFQARNDDGLDDQFDWRDSFESRLFSLRSDVWMSNRDQLQFDAGHVDAVMEKGRLAKNGSGGLTGGEDPDNPFRDYTQSASYAQLLWRRALEDQSDFQLRYSYAEDRASEEHIVRAGPFLVAVDTAGDVGSRHEIEGQHTFAPSERTRLVWGAGYRLDGLSSDTFLHDQGTVYRRVTRAFGNLEWKPTNWLTGNLGAAREYDSLAGHNFSPRGSVSLHLTPDHTVRLGASRAFRTGSIVDYRGDRRFEAFALNGRPVPKGRFFQRSFLADPDMPQERVNTVELGYLGEWKALRSSLDVRLFRERIPNRLLVVRRTLTDPALCDSVPRRAGVCTEPEYTTPVQRVKISGAEYQWRWQPFEATRLMLAQAFVSIDSSFLPEVLSGSGVTSLEIDRDRERVEEHAERSAPQRSTSLLVMQALPGGLDLSVAAYWVDSMKWTRNTSVRFYRRVDLRLGYPFRVGAQRGEIAYTAQSANGKHGEFRFDGDPADRIVDTRQWVSLRLDF